MTNHTFARYDLRTTDVEAAKRFYADAIGLELDTPALAAWPLHEQARARGAPAHWLGNVGVTDLTGMVRRLIEVGSEPLGPVLRAPGGASFAVLRDPLGAVMAVREGALRPEPSPVAWHQLHTRDVDRSWTIYAELFGWSHTETADAPDVEGGHRMFAWEPGGASVGSMANTARWPGVHPHWLFYFRVTDLDGAIAKVHVNAGKALSPAVLPNGSRLAACEDPQGAAFGLLQLP